MAGTPDGLLLAGRVGRGELCEHARPGDTQPGPVERHITSRINSALFDVATTVAKNGDRLALVHARFDLGLPPPFGPGAPPGTTFDVVLVGAR